MYLALPRSHETARILSARYLLAIASDPRPTFAQGGASEADSVPRVSDSASPRPAASRVKPLVLFTCRMHDGDVVLLLCLNNLDAAAHIRGLYDPLLT